METNKKQLLRAVHDALYDKLLLKDEGGLNLIDYEWVRDNLDDFASLFMRIILNYRSLHELKEKMEDEHI